MDSTMARIRNIELGHRDVLNQPITNKLNHVCQLCESSRGSQGTCAITWAQAIGTDQYMMGSRCIQPLYNDITMGVWQIDDGGLRKDPRANNEGQESQLERVVCEKWGEKALDIPIWTTMASRNGSGGASDTKRAMSGKYFECRLEVLQLSQSSLSQADLLNSRVELHHI